MAVYVTQQPTPDRNGWTPNLKPALQYGPIKYVFDGGESVSSNPQQSYNKAMDRLQDFDPKNDYILWANNADPASVIVTTKVLCDMGVEEIPLLCWDRKKKDRQVIKSEGAYIPAYL